MRVSWLRRWRPQRVAQYHPGEIEHDQCAAESGDIADQEHCGAPHDQQAGAGAGGDSGPPCAETEEWGAEHEQKQSRQDERDEGEVPHRRPLGADRADGEEQQSDEADAKAPPLEPSAVLGPAGACRIGSADPERYPRRGCDSVWSPAMPSTERTTMDEPPREDPAGYGRSDEGGRLRGRVRRPGG
jgi:hypothetical protein